MRGSTTRMMRLAAIATAAILAAPLAGGSSDAAVTRPTGPLSLATGSYFGALVNPDRTTPSSTPAEVSTLEAQIGRKLDIVNHFYTYQQFVGTQGEVQDIAGGRIPMVTWGATDTTAINNGSQDSYITAQANRLKNLGAPVFLRYYHEPEGAYRSTIVRSTTAYIAAWKHARTLFNAAGATNVIWVFCNTAYSFRVVPSPPPQAFYPGDAYVDWVAADGYNFAPVKPGANWNDFSTVFGKWYTWSATIPKPMMAAEYGVLEDPAVPGRKGAWYDDMRAKVKTNFPLIQGVIAWDTINVKNGLTYDWRVDSTANSLTHWKAMGADTYFKPNG